MKLRSAAATLFSLDLETLECRQLLSAGDLTFLQMLSNSTSGVSGLTGAVNLTVSPDGRQLYVAAPGSNAVTTFNRDSAGRLTFAQMQANGTSSIAGLGGADTVAVSPDGKNVYVGGATDNAVAIFTRNAATGVLTFQQDLVDNPGTLDGLAGVKWLMLSPDGQNLYAVGNSDNSLAVFTRNASTGLLTFSQSLTNGANGVDGLATPYSVTVSPDGKTVYTAAYGENGVGVFSRDATSGQLTFQSVVKEGDTQGSTTVNDLTHTTMVAVSPDGKSAYVSSYNDHAVVLFTRDSSTGALTYQHAYVNGANNITYMTSVYDVLVSPDGETVYASSQQDSAINVFTRNTTDGTLTLQSVVDNGVNNVSGLSGVFGMAISPNDESLYATGALTNSIVAFDRISHVDVPLGMGGNRALIFHDADGTAVVISMARGAASVRVVGRDLMEKTTNGVVTLTGGGLSNALAGLTADKITLTSTTLASGLVIATSGGAAAGTTLGSLTGSQPIGAIIAPGANLLGTMKLSGTGYARTTVLGDMAASSALEMDGAGTAAGVVISAGTIGANAQMTLACPLARLTAVDWTSGQLNGTRAQTILVTGRPKIGTTAAVTADFGADISLTGKDAAGVALYLLDVPGTFSGNLSASSGGGTPVYGAVRTILAGAWTEGIFQASDLSSLIVRGQVGTVTLHASHAITSLYAAGWTGGLVDAPTLTSLRIPGRLARGTTTAVTGDFGANVTSTSVAKAVIAGKITGNWTDHSITLLWVGGDMSGSTMSLGAAAGTATPALRTLVVGGTISNSTITSTTSIGTVTAGGMTGSKLLVGVNGTNLPTQASDFVTAHPGSIQSVLIRGLRKPDGTWAYSYSNSDIAAWNLGRITLSNIDTSSDTSTAFGVVGHSLTNYVRLQSGQLWTSSGGAVTGPSNAADAPLVVEHAGDFSVKLVPVPAAG